MDIVVVEKILYDLKQPKYRLMQIKKGIFGQLAEKFSEIKELPSDLAEELNEKIALFSFEPPKVFYSKSKESVKALFELRDGKKIESVLMFHHNDRITACVSSQVGCAMSCGFCATGKLGFERNLEADEITDQILFWNHFLKKDGNTPPQFIGKKVNNVVLMGMGEPFLNYDNVLAAIKSLNDHEAFNIGQRHISVSTAGVIPGMEKFAKEKIQVNLAISLHAMDNTTRNKIMPINKKYPLEKLMKAAADYVKKTNRRLMFEYLLMGGLNDSENDAKKLSKMIKKNKLYFVNLILYNETGFVLPKFSMKTEIFNPPSKKKVAIFKKILQDAGVDVIQRRKFGEDIAGACGQLAGKFK